VSGRVVLHSEKQNAVFISDWPITLAATGIQWGKTFVGALWLRRQCHKHKGRDNNYLITAPTYKVLRQSTLPPFLRVFDGLGIYLAHAQEFRLHTGGVIYFRTAMEPDSIVGITNVRAIWCDEAGKYSLYFWQNIEGRAAFKNAPICLTTSPYSLNWIYQDLIRKKREDCFYIHARSDENPHFPKDVFEKRRLTMDPRRFEMMYGGQFGKMVGLVYDCFHENMVVEPRTLPSSTKYYGGIDWGYTEPFSFGVRAITEYGDEYLVSELHKTQLTIGQIKEFITTKQSIYKMERIFCGHDKPELINELQLAGLPAVSVDASPGSKRKGLDLHYELILSGKYKIFKDAAPHTVDEYLTYHYPEPEDLGPDDKANEQLPVEQNDHACFVGDVLITTSRGFIAIKDIKAGMLVLTRTGFKKVLEKHDNGVKKVVCVVLKNSMNVRCTLTHRFFIKQRGFIRLDQVSYTDDFYKLSLWLLIRSHLEELFFGGIRIVRDVICVFIIDVSRSFIKLGYGICTWQFGNLILDKCLSVTASIIKTTTLSIIGFATWSVSLRKSIYQYMRKRDLTKSVGLKLQNSANKRQKNGIDQKRVEFGINLKVNKFMTLSRLRKIFASNVSRRIKLILFPMRVRDFAQTNVEQSPGGCLVLTTKRAFVKNAKILLSLINFPIGSTVLRIINDVQSQRVYDLTIQDTSEYFANGVLVHNCDRERYITISTRRVSDVRSPKVPTGSQKHETLAQRIKRLQSKKREYVA